MQSPSLSYCPCSLKTVSYRHKFKVLKQKDIFIMIQSDTNFFSISQLIKPRSRNLIDLIHISILFEPDLDIRLNLKNYTHIRIRP